MPPPAIPANAVRRCAWRAGAVAAAGHATGKQAPPSRRHAMSPNGYLSPEAPPRRTPGPRRGPSRRVMGHQLARLDIRTQSPRTGSPSPPRGSSPTTRAPCPRNSACARSGSAPCGTPLTDRDWPRSSRATTACRANRVRGRAPVAGMQEPLHEPGLRASRRRLPVVAPPHERRHRHQDRFRPPAGLQPEEGATVVNQAGLDVPAAAYQLELALRPRRRTTASHDRGIGFEPGASTSTRDSRWRGSTAMRMQRLRSGRRLMAITRATPV